MSYRVIVPRAVQEAIEGQVAYLIDESAPQSRVENWLAELYHHIMLLNDTPRRFPVAETVSRAKGFEVRRMNYGDHALYYRVDEDRRIVEIMAFRHGRQRPWLEGDE